MKLKNLFVLLALLTVSAQAKALEISRYPLNPSMSIINLNGEMNTRQESINLENTIQKQFQTNNQFFLQLNSPGGDLDETIYLASVIVKAATDYRAIFHRPLNVIVDVECQSSCTLLMAQLTKNQIDVFQTRILKILVAKDASFKFHGATNRDSNPRIREKREAQVFAAYLNSGVNPKWMSRNFQWFRSARLQAVPASALCSEPTGIIPMDSCRENIDSMVAEVLR